MTLTDSLIRRRRSVSDVRITELLRTLALDVRGVHGSLVATKDGHAVTSAGVDDPAAAAAIVASACGLAQRLAELCGDGELHEMVVRCAGGYAVVYAAGSHAALTVLTDTTTNLALLHLRARDVAADIDGLLSR
jgi:predicted regulator of Ras-like GTPase activity (Roadblock/LC7/MglB family)